MRIAAIVVGAVLFLLGGGMGIGGAVSAKNMTSDTSASRSEWTCKANGDAQTCDFDGRTPQTTHTMVTAHLAQAVVGGAAAICGVLLIGIGTRLPQRPRPALGPLPGHRV